MSARLLASALLVAAAVVGIPVARSLAAPPDAGTYKLDPVHSTVIFGVTHLNVSKVFGRFNEVNGTVTLDDAAPGKSALEISIKVESLDTNNSKRDGHLKSPDFFNAKQFPEI